jgi:hypothetical protein
MFTQQAEIILLTPAFMPEMCDSQQLLALAMIAESDKFLELPRLEPSVVWLLYPTINRRVRRTKCDPRAISLF